MEDFTRMSVELARDARDRFKPEAYVAGSIAPTSRFPRGWDPERVPPADELAREWGDQSEVLAQAGVDLILIESMSAILQALPAMDAARATGLPVLLGIHAEPQGTMSSGETMTELVDALRGREPDAILLMCSPPAAISATLPNLIAAFNGPTGAYANVGYGRAAEPHDWQYHTIDIGSNTPARYAQFCEEWLKLGAQLVGGCCATTPEHIAALRRVV
jgi:homocysteine S-methyltransferase